ncbi:MAG TPA: glycoside hydrolase family 9 [Ignavibacteriales bacterium]|nr:glycoside hydrolase family 9 [Ignavibacteriales bacterium]
MNKLIFSLFYLYFYLLQLSPFAGAQVFVNQAGYLPDLQKIFYTSSAADSFYLVETSSGQIVFRGELYFSVSDDPATNLTLYAGDFSSFTSNGNYFIKINGGDSSYSFQISPTVYDDVYKKSLKGYYFQRCGISLLQPYAGVYYHSACHPGDGFYHSSTGQSGFRLTTGGWHDAGDYGKYVVNSGITVGTLLQAFESYPEKFNQDNLNIPESGNGIPDLLDEVRYEIEWLLKMQNENGGVYFKVTKEQFEPFIMPQNDSGIRYIYTLSSTATGDFAAIMSKAARIYQTIDTSFSNRCLNAAVLAWNFLINNPTIVPVGGFKNPTGTATGEYGDTNDSDERLWAASELFETTGLSDYSTYFISNFATGGIISSSMSWSRVKNLALLTYLNSLQSGASQTVKNQIKNSLISYANTLIGRSSTNGFGIAINPGEYYWGCNSDVLNKALMLIYAYEQTNNNLYVQTAHTQINYILGTNAHNFSFLTGVGSNSVMHPHHRPSVADGVVNPVPGLLAGGPDQYLDDPVLQAHFSGNTPPALCYIDDVGSYASNEIAINWNAPLVFVSGYFNGGSVNSADDQGVNFVPDRFDLKQNFPNPFNPSTTITWQAAVSSWQTIKVYDVLGNEVTKLVDEFRNAGSYAVNFNASQLASGIYFYILQAGDFVQTKKMSLIK